MAVYLIQTRYGKFNARIAKSGAVYRVTVPAYPAVMTEARTESEAKKYAKEVIELQCIAALDDGNVVIDDTKHAFGKFARAGALRVLA